MKEVYLLQYEEPYESYDSQVFFDLDSLAEFLVGDKFTVFNNGRYYEKEKNDRYDAFYTVYSCTPTDKTQLSKNVIFTYMRNMKIKRIDYNIREFILTNYSVKDVQHIRVKFKYDMLDEIEVVLSAASKLNENSVKDFIKSHLGSIDLDIDVKVVKKGEN